MNSRETTIVGDEKDYDNREKDYSNREIDLLLKDIKDILNLVYEQVKKTNGRVDVIEIKVLDEKEWRNRIIGAIAVITAVITVFIVPLSIALITKVIK